MSQTKIKNKPQNHTPVLLAEVLETLAPKNGDTYLDLTAGYGGHANAIIEQTQAAATLVDRDDNAQTELRRLFGDSPLVELRRQDFLSAASQLVAEGKQFDLILADLGVSSPHLDNANRGFSLISDGPLDMRMDQTQAMTAETVVNTYEQSELERILRDYGEEPKARQMAKLIIASRPIQRTTELALVAKKVWPGHSKSHPATRLFQAVRIEVNDELGQLERALPLMVKLLAPGGKLGIITFHSLEDRIVKRFFKDMAGNRYDAELQEVTPRPLGPSRNEVVFNPRSRSAKIRVAAKIKNKIKEGQG